MSIKQKDETLVDKAKSQIERLKTQEGRAALKEKTSDGLRSAAVTIKKQFYARHVHDVKTKLAENLVTSRDWMVTNWRRDGWGKAKVVAAFIVVVFFLRGVFCGWGTSKEATDNSVNAATMTEPVFFAESSPSTSRPEPVLQTYSCGTCGLTIQKATFPAPGKCPVRRPTSNNSDTSHKWRML